MCRSGFPHLVGWIAPFLQHGGLRTVAEMSYENPPSPALSPSAPLAPTARRGIGLPVLAVVGLAAIAVPRIVAHDLALVAPGSPANMLLAIIPLATWIVVATLWSKRPVLSLLVVGGLYGVALAVVHNLSWGVVFGDSPPRLGGNLEGVLAPALEQVLMRGAIVGSGLVTGVATGVACGLLAWGIQAIARRAGERLPIGRS